MMTKKDFEAIAGALYESQARDVVIDRVADVCAALNPRFSAARFKSVAKIDARSPEAKRRAARSCARWPTSISARAKG